MDKAVTFTKKISPVCLPAPADSGNLFVGVDAVVAVTGVAVDDLNDEHQFLQSIKSEKIQQPN